MFTTATAANYRCTEGLLVWYDQEIIKENGRNYLKLTRHASKRYAYLDLTVDAAETIVANYLAFYTRSFAAYYIKENGSIVSYYINECKTEVGRSETPCGGRDVNISVNEVDVKYRAQSTFAENPAQYFDYENERDYEESVHAKTTDGIHVYSRRKNYHVSLDLTIQYLQERISSTKYKYTRYAKKNYEFIGMTQSAAENCAKARRSQYLREYDYLDDEGNNKTRIDNGASVSLRHDSLTWSVIVQVNETDVKCLSYNTDPSYVFSAENGRSYDNNDLLILESVTLGPHVEGASVVPATAVGYCNIPGQTIGNSTFEYRVGEEISWHAAAVEWSSNIGTLELPYSSDPISCRLTCASTESDVVIAS